MLEDVVRTSSYERAIKQQVGSESKVLDFGAGTGVLSIFAARAGAQRVDAIERSSFVEHARRIAHDSGYPEIEFHHADHLTYQSEHKADVLVSEWMGHCLFYEAMLEPLITLRERFLAPDGVMIPARVSVHAALVTDESFHDERAFFLGSPYGIDFSSIAEEPLRQNRRVRLQAHQLDAHRFVLADLDMKEIAKTPPCLSASGHVHQAAMAYGFAAWFRTELTSEVSFGTGPDDPSTHWDQLLFPFPEPVVIVPDRTVTIELCPPRQAEDEDPTWAWSFSDGEQTICVDEHDTFFDPHD